MPILLTNAIVCAVRAHAEHGAIVRVMTPEHGLLAGYVRGGRSTRMRPVLIPGNGIAAEFRARTADQLPSLTVDLLTSRAPFLAEPLPAAAIGWLAALTTTTLPEDMAYPHLHDALEATLEAVCHAPSAKGWCVALARYEQLLLRELGVGTPRAPLAVDTDWPAIFMALKDNRDRLEAELLDGGRRREILAARDMLIERLKRIIA